jgi:manganese/zinc/iron transport system permease protein
VKESLQNVLNNPDIVIVAVGALVGIASSLLGTFLVLRKSSLLADAISHSILLGIILVYLITQNQFSPFYVLGAAIVGVLTVALTELLTNSRRVKSDAAIGLVYPLLFAVAVLLINVFARNVHIDQDAVLLGEIGFVWIDVVTVAGLEIPTALITMVVVTLVNLLFVTLFFKELKLATFDPGLAAALGFSPTLIYYLLLSLTSITAVSAFNSVGAVLLVAFVIVPPATAYLLTDKLWRMLFYGVLISVASSLLGYLLAVALDVSIGGMMVCVSGTFLVLAILFGSRYGLIAQTLQRNNQRRDNAERMLLVHLYNHEHDQESLEENAVDALQTHLRWREAEARDVIARSLEENVIRKQNEKLFLTEKGRVLAQEVLEPWRVAGRV